MAFNNPLLKGNGFVGLGLGAVLTLAAVFVWPGSYVSKSGAEADKQTAVASVQADYCLASYISTPGISGKEITELKGKSTDTQAEFMVKAKHAPDMAAGRACGRKLDRMTAAEISAAEKKAATAAAPAKSGG